MMHPVIKPLRARPDDEDDKKAPDTPAISYDIEEYTDYQENKNKEDDYVDEQINPRAQGEPYS